MSRSSTSRGWAIGLWGLAVGLTVVTLVFLALNGRVENEVSTGSPVVDGLFSVLLLSFPTVGALIALRRPGNAIGWLFLAAGVGGGIQDAGVGWATYALSTDPGSLPGGELAALAADVVWVPVLAATVVLLFLLFPDGRLPSGRWRWLAWLLAADVGLYVTGTTLNPGPLYFFESVSNPLGVEAGGSAIQAVVDVCGYLVPPLIVASGVALVQRWRRSQGERRQQLKWLAYSAGLLTVCFPPLVVASENEVAIGGLMVSELLFELLIALIPVAVGLAILRHRLYDIDLVIRRTLVYGALTAALVATYVGGVLLLQLLLSPLTPKSDLAIAGSTLAVAAAFGPLRGRIQASVDRRFYRRRYDAALTVEAFSARLRDEVALDSLSADLRDVVAETMQPAHVSLWLRGREAPR